MGNGKLAKRILIEIAELAEPLREAISEPENFTAFMRDINWDVFDAIPMQFHEMRPFFESLGDALEIDDVDDQLLESIVTGAFSIVTTLENFSDTHADIFDDDLAAKFAEEFAQCLITAYFMGSITTIGSLLRMLGLVEEKDVQGFGKIPRKIQWRNLPQFIGNPIEYIINYYQWGQDSFEIRQLLGNISALATAFRVRPYFRTEELDFSGVKIYQRILRLPLAGQSLSDLVEVGIGFKPLPATNDLLPGFAIVPYATGTIDAEIELGTGMVLEIVGNLDLEGEAAILIRPNVGITLSKGGTDVSGMIEVALRNQQVAQEKLLLLGTEDGSRFDAAQVSLAGGASVEQNKDAEVYIELTIEDAAIVIKPDASETDSFLAKLLPKGGIEISSSLVIGISNLRGLYFGGSGALQVHLPIHLDLGPVAIRDAFVAIGIDNDAIPLRIGCSISGELGPLDFAVKELGLRGYLTFPPDHKGNIGPINIELGFLPPTGAGFAMDAQWVTGGGFLECDHEKGLYSGALALQLSEIGITAIGLITTQLPDGSEGFSMLVSICITFEPPIQIYMGFTLVGLGGLIGVNRAMQTDVLREGIKKGTLDSILFPAPASVIANASQIISDMQSVFPAEEGRFVIGPMITLGWGTPTVITGEIGVFISIPDPVQIALLGQVEMALPDPDNEIVGIHIDILGVLNIEKKELSFQASIYSSRLAAFKLEGDCAFFLRWGPSQEFALAIGGFHPSFTPPPPRIIFAGLKRLSVTIQYGPVVELQLAGYLALTPNSLQFGSRVGVFVGISEVNAGINGFLSFDGLIIFSPFSFEVNMGGGVTVSIFGFNLADIRVSSTLSGPTPWNIRGTATVNVLGGNVNCDFDFTWGNPIPAIQEAVDLWPRLEEALNRAESWGSRLPAATSMVEVLRPMEFEPVAAGSGDPTALDPIIVHPAGTLEVRQNVAPLELTLDKIGHAPIRDYNRFQIVDIGTGDDDGDHLEVTTIDEYFSRGQYIKLTNQQKLSSPSFEKLPGGVTTAASTRVEFPGERHSKVVGYESIVIKSDRTTQEAPNPEYATLDWSRKGSILASGNAARRGALRNTGAAKFAVGGDSMVAVQEEQYVVVDSETLIPIWLDTLVDAPETGMTRTQAEQALGQQIALHPEQAGKCMVVAEYEAEPREWLFHLPQFLDGYAITDGTLRAGYGPRKLK